MTQIAGSSAMYVSSEGLDHQHVIMIYPWCTHHNHGRCLLGQPRRHCGRQERRVAPLHCLLHHSGASPTQLRRDRRQQTSGPAWRGDKIVDSCRYRSFLRELYGAKESIDVQAKTG
jgi:hypothetical protein